MVSILLAFSSYFTDSLVNKIYAYDYIDGELKNRRLFVDAIAQGFPEKTYCDGLCVDDEGGIWSSRYDSFINIPRKLNQILLCSWGGSRVVRFTKDGELDFQIITPSALNVTACCFGGMYCCSLDLLNADTLKVQTMTKCLSPLPTAEP